MDAIKLKVEPRSVLGKKVRALRRHGVLPANVYGQAESSAIQLSAKEAEQLVSRAGRTTLISLDTDGGEATTVLIKAWQRHPTRGSLLHVDFFRVAMSETLQVPIPLRLVGESPAVKKLDGVLLQPVTTLTVECLPTDIPEAIEIDLSGLEEIDSGVHVRELTLPAGVTAVADPDELVVKVAAPSVAVAVEEAAATEEAAAATEPEETPE